MRSVRKLAGAIAALVLAVGLTGPSAGAAPGGTCRRVGAERLRPEPQVCARIATGQLRWLPIRTVHWYGDSLTWEVQNYARLGAEANPLMTLTVQGLGGTAPCDWTEAIGREFERDHPDVVVLQYSGNSIFPCMQDADGVPLSGDAWLDAYRHDLTALIELVPGADVLVVGAPLPRASVDNDEPTKPELINVVLAQVAEATGATYVDAGAAVLDDNGEYADVLPCLFFESCAGLETGTALGGNPVRSWDGVHFCPTVTQAVNGVVDPCPVYSSGAMRYSAAILEAVDAAIAGLDSVGPS